MENKGLLFIPDISGFTRFVNETEIEHSRYIIQDLLEILINANQIGLEISEIEGDAILFYKYGDAPDLKSIYKQVEKMFCEFHRHLIGKDIILAHQLLKNDIDQHEYWLVTDGIAQNKSQENLPEWVNWKSSV